MSWEYLGNERLDVGGNERISFLVGAIESSVSKNAQKIAKKKGFTNVFSSMPTSLHTTKFEDIAG